MKASKSAIAMLTAISMIETSFADPLLSESFNNGVAQNWTMLDGASSIIDGVFHLTSRSWGDDARAVFQNRNWSDYVLDVDIQIQNAAGSAWPASILFRVQNASSGLDNGQYYQLNVGPNLIAFIKVDGWGQWLAQTNRNVSTGEWHHVRLIVEGNTATAFVDGQQVLSYAGFSDFRSGGIGLKAINSAQILYDNVLVSPALPTMLIRFSQVELSWDTLTGMSYQLQYSSTLKADQWVDLGVAVAGTGGKVRFLDDVPEGSPKRFYRIVRTP